MTRKQMVWTGAIAFLLALIALFPLSLAISLSGVSGTLFSARAIEGTVWSGRIRSLSIDGVPFGDFKASLSPVQLVQGHFGLRLTGEPEGTTRARLLSSLWAYGVDDLNAQIVAPSAFAPLPVESLKLTNVAAEVRGKDCVIAAGQIEAVVDGSLIGLPERITLTGSPRCDGDVILAPLASATGAETLRLRLALDGQYSFRLGVKPADQAMADKLRGIGFAETPLGFELSATGRF